jgi:PAS domain S-box-containing protein
MTDARIGKVSLIPLALGLALVFGVLVYQVYRLEKEKLAAESADLFTASQKMISQWLRQDAEAMGMAMDAMKGSEPLQKAQSKNDPNTLLLLASPALAKLKAEYQIERLNFHGPSRKNILRTHAPDSSGGGEDNFILIQSEKTGEPAWGLDVDETGAVWLRMSHPWVNGGKLLGYIELEKSIYKLGESVKNVLGLEFFLLARKNLVEKGAWARAQAAAGGKGNWDLMDKYALVFSTSAEAPPALSPLMAGKDSGAASQGQVFNAGDLSFMGEAFPIMVGGKEAGAIAVVRDVSGRLASSRKSILASGIISMIAGVAALAFLFISVGKIEKGLSGAQETFRKSEEEIQRLTAAVEQAGDSIIITDPNGVIQYVNPAFVKITGFTRADVLGKKPSIIKSGKHNARFYKKMWNTIKSGKVWQGHFINRKKNGALYEEESTISPIFDAGGKVINYIAIKSDVTLISSLTKAREYFTSVTSHELATPIQRLGFVRTLMANMLKLNKDDDNLTKIVAALDSSYTDLQRVQGATNLLAHLSFNKVEETGRNIFVQPVLSACVESALVESQREGRNVAVAVESASIPVKTQLFGKQDLLQQALDEVLSNAIKYTPDGNKVAVTANLEGTLLEIKVIDEGKGMSETALDQIFEPFFSPSNPSFHSTGRYKYEGGGMGLGLTITRMIVEYHGGTLELRSEGAGKGATARIVLPVFV